VISVGWAYWKIYAVYENYDLAYHVYEDLHHARN